jgi:hypothetical protein
MGGGSIPDIGVGVDTGVTVLKGVLTVQEVLTRHNTSINIPIANLFIRFIL